MGHHQLGGPTFLPRHVLVVCYHAMVSGPLNPVLAGILSSSRMYGHWGDHSNPLSFVAFQKNFLKGPGTIFH